MCLFIVDKEPKNNYLVQICDIDCQYNMEWPIYINKYKFFTKILFLKLQTLFFQNIIFLNGHGASEKSIQPIRLKNV